MRRLADIEREAEALPAEEQAEVLDFIAFLKKKRLSQSPKKLFQTPEEIETFLRSVAIDVSDYRFDREEANVRLNDVNSNAIAQEYGKFI